MEVFLGQVTPSLTMHVSYGSMLSKSISSMLAISSVPGWTGMPPPKVVIVGAGFGGLWAAKTLANAPVEVVVIDRQNLENLPSSEG